jgi:hypothetical protein
MRLSRHLKIFEKRIDDDIIQRRVTNGFFQIDTINKALDESLLLLDKKINKFFFDNYMVNKYLPELAVKIGNIIIDKEGGTWQYDEQSKRMLVVTGSSVRLDFIPFLYRELFRQKYTGYCPTSSMITGLLIGSRIKVVSTDFRQN